MTREEIEDYEGRNVITRAMQPHQDRRSRPDIVHTTDIRPGDLFLLCSDGVLEKLNDARLLGILTANVTDEERCQQLKDATSAASDNHTPYLLHVVSVESEPSDATAPHNEDSSRANLIVIERGKEAEGAMNNNQAKSTSKSVIKKVLGWLGLK